MSKNKAEKFLSLDILKKEYLEKGLTAKVIADEHGFKLSEVKSMIKEHNLEGERKKLIKKGLEKIQNKQVEQADKILKLELDFKKLRLVQLEQKLEEYLAYFGRHGDFYKRHPVTGDTLKDSNGMKMQINIPSISREIDELKKSVSMSQGLKSMLVTVETLLGNSKGEPEAEDDDLVSLDSILGRTKK